MPHPHSLIARPALLAAALCLAPACVATDRAPAASTAAARTADRLLDELQRMSGVPGLGAAVWVDGAVAWRGSAGLRDVENGQPVDADTRFRFASVSKLVTATAAAQLAADGRLDIDAPVAAIGTPVNPAWAPMTARQLAAHTAGLPHYQSQDAGRGGTRYASVDNAVALFRDRPLPSAPGTRYEYSSWGYTLLSAVVEAAARRPFLDVVTTDVTPGLAIGADGTDGGDPDASRAYRFVDGAVQRAAPHDFSYTWGGGGLAGTPSALATFGGRLLRGEGLPRAQFEAMLVPARLADGTVVRDEDYAVGFGWRTDVDIDGERRAHHAGVTDGARSALVLWPDGPPQRQAAVALLSNALWVASIEQSAAMLAAPFRATPAALVKRDCPLDAVRYRGRYGDQPIEGLARFTLEDGTCIGTLAIDGASNARFAERFNRHPQRDTDALRIVALQPDAGLSRAALVTPIGLYDLRARADGGFDARMSGGRLLSVGFTAADRR